MCTRFPCMGRSAAYMVNEPNVMKMFRNHFQNFLPDTFIERVDKNGYPLYHVRAKPYLVEYIMGEFKKSLNDIGMYAYHNKKMRSALSPTIRSGRRVVRARRNGEATENEYSSIFIRPKNALKPNLHTMNNLSSPLAKKFGNKFVKVSGYSGDISVVVEQKDLQNVLNMAHKLGIPPNRIKIHTVGV